MEQGSAELLGREAFPTGANWGWERMKRRENSPEATAQPWGRALVPPQGIAESLGSFYRTETPKQWKMFAFFIPEKVTSAVLKRRIGSPPEARAEQCGQRGLGPVHGSLRVRPGWAAARTRGRLGRRGSLRHVLLFEIPWTIQSTVFSRPEYWSGQPFPSPGDHPNSGIEPSSSELQADSLPAEPQGKSFCF